MNYSSINDILDRLSRRKQCDQETSNAVLARIENEKLTPIESGCSLHCWNAIYLIDGITYDVTGELSSDWKMVEIIQP